MKECINDGVPPISTDFTSLDWHLLFFVFGKVTSLQHASALTTMQLKESIQTQTLNKQIKNKSVHKYVSKHKYSQNSNIHNTQIFTKLQLAKKNLKVKIREF